jgi:hypothetical protein
LLIGYLYGIDSERKLVEELRMHLARRWFTSLGFEQEVPHHSTFSKNRHGRNRGGNHVALSTGLTIWNYQIAKNLPAAIRLLLPGGKITIRDLTPTWKASLS